MFPNPRSKSTGGHKAAEAMLWFLHPDGMRAKVVLLAEALVMALRLERHYRPLTLSEWMGILGSHVTLPMLERLMRRAVELMRDRISKDLAAWRRQLVEARLEHDQVRRAEQESGKAKGMGQARGPICKR